MINSFICAVLLRATIRHWWRESVVNRSIIINYVTWKCHTRNIGFSYRYWVQFTELYLITLTWTTFEAFYVHSVLTSCARPLDSITLLCIVQVIFSADGSASASRNSMTRCREIVWLRHISVCSIQLYCEQGLVRCPTENMCTKRLSLFMNQFPSLPQ